MSKRKLVTSNVQIHGQKITFPIDGEVKVSPEGAVNVSDDLAEILLNGFDGTFSEEAKKETKKPKTTPSKKKDKEAADDKGAKAPPPEAETEKEDDVEDTADKSEDEEDTADKDDEGANEKLSKDELKELTLEELIETANDLGIDKKEYEKFQKNKMLMINFLYKKQ